MVVLRLARPRRDTMNVYVEYVSGQQSNRRKSALFPCLAQGNLGQAKVAVGMASRLQPHAKLGMVQEKYLVVATISKPHRAGEVRWITRALRTPRLRPHQISNIARLLRVGLIEPTVGFQDSQELLPRVGHMFPELSHGANKRRDQRPDASVATATESRNYTVVHTEHPYPRAPTPVETATTVRLERWRAVATGIFESAPSTFLLLILVRWFDGTSTEKSLMAAAYQSGLIFTPLSLFVTRYFSWSPSRAMAALLSIAAALYFGAAVIPDRGVFVVLTSIGSLMVATTSPLLTTMMNNNYPARQRGLIYSQNNSIKIATSIVFGTVAGWALSGRLQHYQLLIIFYAAALAISAALMWRVPRCGEPLAPRPLLSCFRHIGTDSILRNTLIAWMFLGFGNLMMVPLRIEYLANPRYGLHLSEIDIALLVSTIPHLARLLASPVWGRLFDQMNFFSLRITINFCFLLSVLSFFSSDTFFSLGIAAVIFGLSNSGGDVAWSLWVTKFAPAGMVPDYMAVHTFFTGIRGLLAPMTAFALLNVLPLTTLMWISTGLMFVATVQLFFIRGSASRSN